MKQKRSWINVFIIEPGPANTPLGMWMPALGNRAHQCMCVWSQQGSQAEPQGTNDTIHDRWSVPLCTSEHAEVIALLQHTDSPLRIPGKSCGKSSFGRVHESCLTSAAPYTTPAAMLLSKSSGTCTLHTVILSPISTKQSCAANNILCYHIT